MLCIVGCIYCCGCINCWTNVLWDICIGGCIYCYCWMYELFDVCIVRCIESPCIEELPAPPHHVIIDKLRFDLLYELLDVMYCLM